VETPEREELVGEKMKIAIVGSRGFPRPKVVNDFVNLLPADTTIISGRGNGVDTWAEEAAKKRGLGAEIYPVDTRDMPNENPARRIEFTKRAYARNQVIAEECELMVAFWDGSSGGTKDVMARARKRGVVVTVIGPTGTPRMAYELIKGYLPE
jgi:hypothetical protein